MFDACLYITLSCHHCLVCVDTHVKTLKRENANLKETIESLRRGDHDIELRDGSQEDMVDVFAKCNADASLDEKINCHDKTGKLALFWKEQKERMSDPSKTRRKPWNPIVLRCVSVCRVS